MPGEDGKQFGASAGAAAVASPPPPRAPVATHQSTEPSSAQNLKAAIEDATAPDWTNWRNLWQVPTILISAALIIWAITASMRPPAANDFDGAFKKIDELIAAGQFEAAAGELRAKVESKLSRATAQQQARFHATLADLLFAAQQAQGDGFDALKAGGMITPHAQEVHTKISQEYSQAQQLGLTLDAKRMERWAQALLAIGDINAAQKRIDELDAIGGGDQSAPAGSEILASRNAIFRGLIETAMRQSDLSFEQMMKMLADFRLTPGVSQRDQLWAIARQTELRLEAGLAQQAVDYLLVDLRRFESLADPQTVSGYGELYLLLARGYYDLGDYQRAQRHLESAMKQLSGSDALRGDVLALMGRIAMLRGDMDVAHEAFELVVRDFIGTRSYLPGLLGRAQVRSLLGEHADSQADYRELAGLLRKVQGRRDISALHVAESLCDRHDAALALGKVDLALEYASIAESFFTPDRVPVDVLLRLASTNRQIADNLLASVRLAGSEALRHGGLGTRTNPGGFTPSSINASFGDIEGPPASIDPAIRYEANVRYQRAAEYYLRHAQAVTGALSKDEWAASLWMAADSFDRAGRQAQAIEQFARYLDSRPVDDARHAETLFRLGQAYQAIQQYQQAIPYYEQVLADRTRSEFAAQTYVLLARCYWATNRKQDAMQQLRSVLAGDRLLNPNARDYHDAMLELGRMHHQQGEFTAAIELFAQAVQRYPDDPRRFETMFALADSYRRNAYGIDEQIKNGDAAGLSPTELGRLTALRSEHLQAAEDFFTGVCHGLGFGLSEGDPIRDRSPMGTPSISPEPTTQSPEPRISGSELLRLAMLYRGDCAFHLGKYQDAIDRYDQVSRRYSGHQCSMYALVQIVNCYSALGDSERAAAAHSRAMVRLKQLPDSAFATPDALMDRAAWERWLENTPPAIELSRSPQANTG